MLKKINKLGWVVLLFGLATLFFGLKLDVAPAAAQSGAQWSPPIQLSPSDVQSWAPTIAADKAGNVHVIWSQTMTANPPPGEGDTLFYTRFDGNQWTQPVDVLVSPKGGAAEWPDMVISPDDMIHLVWGSGGTNSRLMYSQAPACCANDLSQWSKPVALAYPILNNPAIAVDKKGIIHVAYSLNQPGGTVMYMRSVDGGKTWSDPVSLPSGTRRDDEYTSWPRLAVDDLGRVHLVWTVLPYPGRAVMYARSDDGGLTWNTPQMIDSYDRPVYTSGYGPILINVATHGDNQVHLIWIGEDVQRYHIWSSDGGNTWSSINELFPEVKGSGRSGWNAMAFDSNNVLHAVSLISIGPALAATWDGTRWSPSDRVALSGPATTGVELVDLAISRGDELNVVWLKKDVQPFTVWFARGKIDAPELPVQPLSTPLSEPTAIATGTPLAGGNQSPTATPVFLPEDAKSPPPSTGSNPMDIIFMGIIPAALLLGVVLLVVVRQFTAGK